MTVSRDPASLLDVDSTDYIVSIHSVARRIFVYAPVPMGESAIAMCECANVVYTVSFDLRMYLCVTGKMLLQDETRRFVVIPVNSHDAIRVLH